MGGVRAFARAGDLPEPPDLAVVCTPRAAVARVVRDCGEAGAGGLVIITAGYAETGQEGRAAQDDLATALADHPGLRAVGPNCLGVIVPGLGLNASFAADMPAPGRLAFVSQSGALCTAVLDWAVQQGVGFSHFISVGNMVDVDFGDLIDWLAAASEAQALLLYVESITAARKFVSAARAFTRSKPIVAYKAGRFAESARAAASHTGAMAGDDRVYEAAFRRAGIERVDTIDDLFDCAELLSRRRGPTGRRLAIVTNAGGPGVVATDALLARGGALARLGNGTIEALGRLLPPHASRSNPVDVLGDATAERLAEALRITLADPGVDAALVVLAPQAVTEPGEAARAVARIASATPKTVLAAWMGGRRMQEGFEILGRAGVPVYHGVEDSIDAFTHLVSYGRNLEILDETPRDVPIAFTPARAAARERLRRAPAAAGPGTVLGEIESKELLAAYGIEVCPAREARSADEAAAAARDIGAPVVLKVLSPQITHKSDVRGVALGLRGEAEVREAFARIVSAAAAARPEADVLGVTVQPMVAAPGALELILGVNRDPTFGAAILVGAGGTLAEILGDFAVELPPLNERLARRMLDGLRVRRLLEGWRGRPPLDAPALVDAMIRFSYLVADSPALRELDVNPLLVMERGVVALDARAVVEPGPPAAEPRPFSHLAIRPYPEDLVRPARLPDSTRFLLRPIRPEDEPLWHALLARCSPESVWFRLGAAIRTTTHKMATRYCFIDYDREIAIVAEHGEGAERRLAGVGRLVSDADHERAEYAVLVEDAWQGRGLGSLLTDYCLEVAAAWGVVAVTATTAAQNARMLRIFRNRGFELRPAAGDRVAAELVLAAPAAPTAAPPTAAPGGARKSCR